MVIAEAVERLSIGSESKVKILSNKKTMLNSSDDVNISCDDESHSEDNSHKKEFLLKPVETTGQDADSPLDFIKKKEVKIPDAAALRKSILCDYGLLVLEKGNVSSESLASSVTSTTEDKPKGKQSLPSLSNRKTPPKKKDIVSRPQSSLKEPVPPKDRHPRAKPSVINVIREPKCVKALSQDMQSFLLPKKKIAKSDQKREKKLASSLLLRLDSHKLNNKSKVTSMESLGTDKVHTARHGDLRKRGSLLQSQIVVKSTTKTTVVLEWECQSRTPSMRGKLFFSVLILGSAFEKNINSQGR